MAINQGKSTQGSGFGGDRAPQSSQKTQPAKGMPQDVFEVVDQGNTALLQIKQLLENNGDALVQDVAKMADDQARRNGMGIAMHAHPDVVAANSGMYAVNFLQSCGRRSLDLSHVAQSQGLPSVQRLEQGSLSGLYDTRHNRPTSKQIGGADKS